MIKRVNWLEIKVTDIKKAISFYRDVLGLKIKNEWSNYVIFDMAGTLTFAVMLGGKKGRKEGAPNIYLAVDNLDEGLSMRRYISQSSSELSLGLTYSFSTQTVSSTILQHPVH